MTNGEYIRKLDNNGLAAMLAKDFSVDLSMDRFVPDCDAECDDKGIERYCSLSNYQGDCSGCPMTIAKWLDAER